MNIEESQLSRMEAMKMYEFESMTGRIIIDHDRCLVCDTKACVPACKTYDGGILKVEEGKCVLAITPTEAKRGGCIECLACEFLCEERGKNAIQTIFPIPPS